MFTYILFYFMIHRANQFHFFLFFLYAVSADIVVFENSIENAALLSVDNFPQHLNAVHVFSPPQNTNNAVL